MVRSTTVRPSDPRNATSDASAGMRICSTDLRPVSMVAVTTGGARSPWPDRKGLRLYTETLPLDPKPTSSRSAWSSKPRAATGAPASQLATALPFRASTASTRLPSATKATERG